MGLNHHLVFFHIHYWLYFFLFDWSYDLPETLLRLAQETYNPFAASSDPKRLNKMKIHDPWTRPGWADVRQDHKKVGMKVSL